MKRITSVMLAVLLIVVTLLGVACQQDPPQKFKVTFDTQDGNEAIVVETDNGLVTPPADPTNKYAKFLGWFEDKEGTIPWDSAAEITADKVVYASWKKSGKVYIKFDANYEGAEEIKSITTYRGFPTELPTATREYYTFVGWFDAREDGVQYTNETIITDGVQLYAHWVISADHTHDMKLQKEYRYCDKEGYDLYACVCGFEEQRGNYPATGHDFSKVGYLNVLCANGCFTAVDRLANKNIYEDVFVYTFNEDKKAEIDSIYADLIDAIESAAKYDATAHAWAKPSALYDANKEFEHNFYDKFYEQLEYVTEQYQYAQVFLYQYDGENGTDEKFEFISDVRTNMIKDYYKLFRLIYETQYREYFFSEEDGWTEEDIAMALAMSDQYGNDEYAAINERLTEIEIASEEISSPATDKDFLEMYAEFVSLNNQLAKLSGYNNYPEYAYENVYEREYSPADVAKMRNYIKTYITPTFEIIVNNYLEYGEPKFGSYTLEYKIYKALTESSIFEDDITLSIVGSYLEQLKAPAGTAGKAIDFHHHASKLMENGNYYTGKRDAAFSYYIPAQDATILYFGPGSYSGAFTFVHEFGHYYDNVYNSDISVSMDHSETQSQGNEMLFLAYLEDYLKNDKMYNGLVWDQLFNMLAISILATAVDEFEYSVYTNYYDGSYGGKDFTDGIDSSEYQSLFTCLLNEYGVGQYLNDEYWSFVVVSSPCYYISYAMSALPSVGIYVKAMTEGFEAARDSYLKLFSFSDDERFVTTDYEGNREVNATYQQVLNYCGLYGPFQENLYVELNEYLLSFAK